MRRAAAPDSITKNAALSFVAQLTSASFTALITLFLVRALGPHDYGLFALALGVGSISLVFADLGISNSTGRFVAERRDRAPDLRRLVIGALKLKLCVSALVCVALALAAPLIADAYGEPGLAGPLRGMALATFGQTLLLMLLTIGTAMGRTAVNVRLVAAESFLEASATICLVTLGAGAAGAAFGRAAGYVLGSIFGLLVVLRLTAWRRDRRSSAGEPSEVRRIGGYAGGLFVIDAAHTFGSNLNVLLLGAYLGPAASGLFQAPYKLITFLQYVGLSAANGVAPRLARREGHQPDVSALQAALRWLIYFQCLLLAPVIVWAQPIVDLLLGGGYDDAAGVLAALAPFIFCAGFAPILTNGINYLGEARRRLPLSITTLVLTGVGGAVLIPWHGLIGAAVATDIAYGFYTVSHLWLCRRLLGLRLRTLARPLAGGLAGAAAMTVVLIGAGTAEATLLGGVLGGLGGAVAYAATLWLCGAIHRSDAERIVRLVALAVGGLRGSRAAKRPV